MGCQLTVRAVVFLAEPRRGRRPGDVRIILNNAVRCLELLWRSH